MSVQARGRGRDWVGGTWLRRLGAIALLLFMGIIWGGALAFAKAATNFGGHPFGLALWQALSAGCLLLVLSILNRSLPPLRLEVLRFNFACAFVGLVIPSIGLFWISQHLQAGVVSLTFASMPLITYVLVAAFGAERLRARRLFGVVVGISAIAVMVLPEGALPELGLVHWVFLGLFCSLAMSTENLFIALRRPPEVPALAVSCGRQFAGALVIAPLAILTGTTVPLFVPWGDLQWAATTVGVFAAVAYTLFLYSIRTAGAVFSSQVAYIITLAGVAWGMFLFDERHSVYFWAALALMMGGLMLVQPLRRTSIKT